MADVVGAAFKKAVEQGSSPQEAGGIVFGFAAYVLLHHGSTEQELHDLVAESVAEYAAEHPAMKR